jgi:hypothetical protein
MVKCGLKFVADHVEKGIPGRGDSMNKDPQEGGD